jgi:hypothetical protein
MFGGMLPLFLFIFTLFEQTYNIYIYYSSSTLMLSSWLPLGRGPPLKQGAEAALFPEKEYIKGIFVAVYSMVLSVIEFLNGGFLLL